MKINYWLTLHETLLIQKSLANGVDLIGKSRFALACILQDIISEMHITLKTKDQLEHTLERLEIRGKPFRGCDWFNGSCDGIGSKILKMDNGVSLFVCNKCLSYILKTSTNQKENNENI